MYIHPGRDSQNVINWSDAHSLLTVKIWST